MSKKHSPKENTWEKLQAEAESEANATLETNKEEILSDKNLEPENLEGPPPSYEELKTQLLNIKNQLKEQEQYNKSQLAELKEQLNEQERLYKEKEDEYKKRALYQHAEIENILRRTQLKLTEAQQFGQEALIQAILSVKDSLEKAEATIPKTIFTDSNPDLSKTLQLLKQLNEGLEHILRQIQSSILTKFKVTTITPSIGELYDPHQHQAMCIEESEEYEPDTIIKVLEKGYSLHGRVIRPALVVVSKTVEKMDSATS